MCHHLLFKRWFRGLVFEAWVAFHMLLGEFDPILSGQGGPISDQLAVEQSKVIAGYGSALFLAFRSAEDVVERFSGLNFTLCCVD